MGLLDDRSAAQCCDKVYFCPTSGDTECPVHGGFDVCCDRPDLHRPVASAARIDCLYDESVYLFYRRRRLRWQFVGYGNSVAALMSHGKVVGPFPSYVEAHRAL